jgi:hypothetical protein
MLHSGDWCMRKIISVIGVRPNFINVVPLQRALLPYKEDIRHLICHTGQHYDEKMSRMLDIKHPMAGTPVGNKELGHNPSGSWKEGLKRCDQ